MMKFPWLFNDVFFKSKDIVLVNKIATVNPDDHDQIIIVLIWSVIQKYCFVTAIKTFHEWLNAAS